MYRVEIVKYIGMDLQNLSGWNHKICRGEFAKCVGMAYNSVRGDASWIIRITCQE